MFKTRILKIEQCTGCQLVREVRKIIPKNYDWGRNYYFYYKNRNKKIDCTTKHHYWVEI